MESERDRAHFRTGELFICFTSSSSSMKLTKSILSPGRAGRDASLSCSVSRRLRSNGSLKGGASPYFTTAGKKRGCGFENPEPSSPKVTCIGQVRVKTKKKVKRSGSVSRRRRMGGEVSFRKTEKNQRWVHLPMSICEAVRAEFSCLFPCTKSSCLSTTKDDENGSWLVSEGGMRKEERVSSRRHAFEDIEVKDDRIELKGVGEEEEGARVSICIPPKNALLLMRCRSDPVKMAALANANRFSWDIEQEVEETVGACEGEERVCEDEIFEQDHPVLGQVNEEKEIPDPNLEETISTEEMVEEDKQQEILWNGEESGEEEEEVESNMSSFEALLVQEKYENSPVQDNKEQVVEEDDEEECPICHLPPSDEEEDADAEPPPLPLPLPEEEEEAAITTQVEEREVMLRNESHENGEVEIAQRQKKVVLPECLVLMMCEPKLSMEVSEETWVCSADFIRWKRRLSIDSKPKMIEQKVVAYEPFVLSRCKSEPMKTAAAKLMPTESCFWKNAMSRKLEPHRPGLGV